jgi:NTP pyrophosphatase (non-canonical NTP hydrolase)
MSCRRDGVRTQRALALVDRERQAQRAKWGRQQAHPMLLLAILAEEVGELAEECVKELGEPEKRLHAVAHGPRGRWARAGSERAVRGALARIIWHKTKEMHEENR